MKTGSGQQIIDDQRRNLEAASKRWNAHLKEARAKDINPHTTDNIDLELRQAAFFVRYGTSGDVAFNNWYNSNRDLIKSNADAIAKMINPNFKPADDSGDRKERKDAIEHALNLVAQGVIDRDNARKKYPGIEGEALNRATEHERFLNDCKKKIN